jgi:hypothetical protein
MVDIYRAILASPSLSSFFLPGPVRSLMALFVKDKWDPTEQSRISFYTSSLLYTAAQLAASKARIFPHGGRILRGGLKDMSREIEMGCWWNGWIEPHWIRTSDSFYTLLLLLGF